MKTDGKLFLTQVFFFQEPQARAPNPGTVPDPSRRTSEPLATIRQIIITFLILRNARSATGIQNPLGVFFGDEFGESLGGSQAPPSFWKAPGLPRKFPQLPRKFLPVELNSRSEVPRKFPRLPRKYPEPGGFPDFPGGQPPLLGSLTLSLDSQKLPR